MELDKSPDHENESQKQEIVHVQTQNDIIRQIEAKISTNTEGLKEVKISSVQLMAALDDLENRQDTFASEIRKEIAKLEFSTSKAEAEKSIDLGNEKVLEDTIAALRTDLRASSNRIDVLSLKLSELEEKQILTKTTNALNYTRDKIRNIRNKNIKDNFVDNIEFQKYHDKLRLNSKRSSNIDSDHIYRKRHHKNC